MIGNTLVLVCAVVGLAAGTCVSTIPTCGTSVLSGGFVGGVGAPVLSTVGGVYGTGVYGDGLVGAGLYGAGVYGAGVAGVAGVGGVATNGPETAPLPVVQAPSVTLPTVESPVVALPSQPIPAPRVIAQRCVCTKTIVRPQVIQRQVTVPKIQRYLKRTVTPVVENVTFKSRPVPAGGCAGSVVAPAVGSSVVGYNSGACYASRTC